MRSPTFVLFTLLALGGAMVTSWAGRETGDAGVPLFRFADQRIKESSGIAASSHSDDILFTHNDSGDGPFVYAVDAKGATAARWRIEGAVHLDWEDMARGPRRDGKPALFLGDIGDNFRLRPSITVYEVAEPPVDPSKTGVEGVLPLEGKYQLRFQDQAHDAECLLIHPKTGRLFIVTKSQAGSGVYAAPPVLQQGPINLFKKVAEVRFDDLPATPGSERDPQGRLLATGGAFSPDGKKIVLRTYTSAYEWTIDGDDVAGAFKKQPTAIALPNARGGEAITYSRDGRWIIVCTEGVSAPVHRILRP